MPTDPKSKAGDSLPLPWREFISELDSMLPEPLDLHCIGGFVICYFYGLPRPTGDIDYYSAVPQSDRNGGGRLRSRQEIQNSGAPSCRYESARGLRDKVD